MSSKSFISTLLALPHYPNNQPLLPDLEALPDIVSSRKFISIIIVTQKNSPPPSATNIPELNPAKCSKDVMLASLYHKKLLADTELNQKFAFSIFRGRVIFILTLFLTCTTAILFFASPSNLFPKWYTVAVIFMLLCRVTDYTQKKEHFFLIDFCYTAGLQILFFLIWRSQSVHLTIRTFGFGAGILGWSTVLFSNGLTIHRLDEFCSLWIHTVPSLLAYTLRWTNENSVIFFKSPGFDFSSDHVLQYYIACYAPYIVWATGYYIIITKGIKALTDGGNYPTLITFLADKSSLTSKILNIFGSKRRTEAFMLSHWVFFTLTTLVSYVCFFYRPLHTFCVIVQVYSMVFHGAKKLAEDIAKPYLSQLEKINLLLTSLG
jgi:hypothetical protein